jgi:pimeloyl-ACP methyl ester carboxylesterase
MSERTFVLVSGAWHGGWVWRDFAARLRAQGHVVTTPTLTGLGERRHLMAGSADLSTHIEDVVAHNEMEGLEEVDLLGWSYGGMVISGVQARIPGKIRSLIYYDAFVPEDGKAMVDCMEAANRAHYEAGRDADRLLEPIPMAAFGVTDPAVLDFVTPRIGGQPWRTFFEPVRVSPDIASVPQTYILCTEWSIPSPMTRFVPVMEARGARIVTIAGSHLSMLTEPEETLEAILATPRLRAVLLLMQKRRPSCEGRHFPDPPERDIVRA